LSWNDAAVVGVRLNPNSEAAAAQAPGSTGHRPVPSGYQPPGTTVVPKLFLASLVKGGRLAVPSGRWPDGTGWQPVLPSFTSEFELNTTGRSSAAFMPFQCPASFGL